MALNSYFEYGINGGHIENRIRTKTNWGVIIGVNKQLELYFTLSEVYEITQLN